MNLLSLTVSILLLSNSSFSSEKIQIGKFKSRAIYNQQVVATCPAPLVIMIPGSGANGPEEMMPSNMTGDGQDHSLFESFSNGLNSGGVSTLALGKPGIEYFNSWDKNNWFYDQDLYTNLNWQDLVDNLNEAVLYAKQLPCVDTSKIYILGHSEGTQVAPDYATQHPELIKGLILIGFSGENLHTTVDWQLFQELIDSWLSPDVDINHDGFISYEETKNWPEFHWNFKDSTDKVSFDQIESTLRQDSNIQSQFSLLSNKKIWEGVFDRKPLYEEIASLNQDIFVFTGSLDVQTRPEESLKLKDECSKKNKLNCEISIVEGLGHGMSKPRAPRAQKLLDSTLGPVEQSFIDTLKALAKNF